MEPKRVQGTLAEIVSKLPPGKSVCLPLYEVTDPDELARVNSLIQSGYGVLQFLSGTTEVCVVLTVSGLDVARSMFCGEN
jgi:16S rRNA C1402 (ribose-2'-O) methylase RsmI